MCTVPAKFSTFHAARGTEICIIPSAKRISASNRLFPSGRWRRNSSHGQIPCGSCSINTRGCSTLISETALIGSNCPNARKGFSLTSIRRAVSKVAPPCAVLSSVSRKTTDRGVSQEIAPTDSSPPNESSSCFTISGRASSNQVALH